MTATDPFLIRVSPVRDTQGKVADAELIFTTGVLAGLTLAGFSVWRSKRGDGFYATVPTRTYEHGGERRLYHLLRPSSDEPASARTLAALKQALVDAYTAQLAGQGNGRASATPPTLAR